MSSGGRREGDIKRDLGSTGEKGRRAMRGEILVASLLVVWGAECHGSCAQ